MLKIFQKFVHPNFLPDTTRFSEKKNEELMVDLRVEKCVDIDIWFHFLNGFA